MTLSRPRDRDPHDLLPLKPIELLVLTMLSVLPFGRRVLAAELRRLRALMRVAEANRVIASGRA